MNIATLGTAAAVLRALPVAFLAARNTTFNRGTYLFARLLIVVSRSVDSLIWALIFIIIVGPGALAGALAVGVRSLGFVAKLFAEGIEEIDRGQVEAVTPTEVSRALRPRSQPTSTEGWAATMAAVCGTSLMAAILPSCRQDASHGQYPVVDSGGKDSPIARVQ